MQSNTPPHSPLVDAFYQHCQASLHLARVALELEWTVFTRFTVGVIVATFVSVVYLVWTLRHSRRPLVVWEKLNKPLIKLFRPRIFAYLLGYSSPYSGSIDIRVSTFSRGFCTGIMRDRVTNRNALKHIHATAVTTFAETVGTLAMQSTLKEKDGATLTSLHVDFKKPARGLLTASSEITVSVDEDTTEIQTDVVVKDRMLDTVAVARLVWSIARGDA